MSLSVGIGMAFLAMLGWGIGDFLLQKSIRKVGNWETLFIVTIFGAIILFPFAKSGILELFYQKDFPSILVLMVASIVLFVAALLDFEALKRGKISVVEPIWSVEIVSATVLSFVVLKEVISLEQIILIALLTAGLFLVSFQGKIFSKSFLMEKGVFIAFVAAIVMGGANFFVGWGARLTDAIVINFVFNFVIAVLSGLYLLYKKRFLRSFGDFVVNRKTMIPMVIADNTAWVAYAFSMAVAPIAVATALSESYIIIAVILGLAVGKEKLQFRQKVGLILAIVTAIWLASITV